MRNYWTCSKFADWLRGTNKLKCGTLEEWRDWETQAKAKHPVRWWLAEEGLDYLQKFVFFVPDRLHSIKYYINNRWVTQTHRLTAHPRDIKPGEWRDVGDRFLPCLFNELQDFVELELAWNQIAWSDKAETEKYAAPFWAKGWFRTRTWRCPQAGIDNLNWQRNLRYTEDEAGGRTELVGQLTPQAKDAQEIYELYMWWTQEYRNRVDPDVASGWNMYCDLLRNETGDDDLGIFVESKDPELRSLGKRSLELQQEIEKAYIAEDTQMMNRLINVRHALWT